MFFVKIVYNFTTLNIYNTIKMKTLNSKIIRVIYWCFVAGFILHVIATLYTIGGYLSETPLIVSEVRVIPIEFNDRLIEQTSNNSKSRIFEMTNAHASVKYNEIASMEKNAWIVFMVNILHQLIWLWFTWLLLRVFKSLSEQAVFEQQNITRLRLVALIVGFSPILQVVKNLVFESVLKNKITLTDKYIAFYYDYSTLSGFFYMLLVLILVEVFRYGMTLKHESDFTI